MELIDELPYSEEWFYPYGPETEEEKVHAPFWSIPWVQEHTQELSWIYVLGEPKAHLPRKMMGRSTPGEQGGFGREAN